MLNVRLAGDHLFGKLLSNWLSLVMSMMVSFVLSFFPQGVLDEILNLIGSVSEGFPSYSSIVRRRPSTLSDDFFSETTGPTVTNFHMWPPGVGEKVVQMVWVTWSTSPPCPYMVNKVKKIFLSRTN